MTRAFDPVCFNAFERLLARPDAPDLPRRAHVYRYSGDPERRVTRLPSILMGWLQRRHLERDVFEAMPPAIRTGYRVGRPGAIGDSRHAVLHAPARVFRGKTRREPYAADGRRTLRTRRWTSNWSSRACPIAR
jgi:hypothetical protein